MGFEKPHFEEFTENDKPKKKEQPKKQAETIVSKEKPIDQQKFIDNKYIRIDSVFDKEASKVKVGRAAAWDMLDTKRWDITFHIEKNAGGWKNAEVTVTEWKDNYSILIETDDSGQEYKMTVLKNKALVQKSQSNAIVTKYISML